MKVLNFGSLNVDYVYTVDHIMQPGGTQNSVQRSVFAGGKGLARDRRGDGRGDREGYGGGWSVALLGNGSQGGAFFLRYCGVIGSESPRI